MDPSPVEDWDFSFFSTPPTDFWHLPLPNPFVANPVLDAWNGARKWARSLSSLQTVSVTRQEYEEKGGDYLREHFASNRYVPTPTQSWLKFNPKQFTVSTVESNRLK